MEELKNQLIERYKTIFEDKENQPKWAVRKTNSDELIHPAIPFIGKYYEKHRVLVYASAENLTNEEPYLDNNDKALMRRFNEGSNKNKDFFRQVHIGPINDGSLLLTSAYILNKIGVNMNYNDPKEFINSLAVDNFCKFTTVPVNGKNIDYADDINKLKYSFEYIKADIEILKPEIIILPIKIYETVMNKEKDLYNNIKTIPNRFPIYQINARNINLRIQKKYVKKDKDLIYQPFLEWQKHLSNGITGKTNDNFYAVYTYLDEIIDKRMEYNK